MPKQGEIFRQRMFEALALVWKAMGWHRRMSFTTPSSVKKRGAGAEIQMEWDEASCGQLVWLYNKPPFRYAGRTESQCAAPDRIASLNPA